MNISSSRPAVLAAAVLALVMGAVAGCSSPRRSEPVIGPIVLSDPNLVRGRMLFDRHCYKCHLEGEGGMSPALNNKPLPKFMVRYQVRLGLGAMPAFGREQLSDAELDSVVDYVSYLRHPRIAPSSSGR